MSIIEYGYTADFETTTDENDCRVWAYAVCSIENEQITHIGNNINDFIKILPTLNKVYFHNLKFDGEFIIHYLLSNGFKHVKKKEWLTENTFTTLISDMGQFYIIEIKFENSTVKIYDSLKILPFSVDVIAKSFNLPLSKLEIDYTAKREIGHNLSQDEIDYISNDVLIVAKALKIMFNQKLTAITQGSNALKDYKRILTTKKFEKLFPIPDYDYDIRQSYKGGFTYVNEKVKGKEIGRGIVLDVNSLYPSVMYYNNLPYGEGKFFTGKYIEDEIYNVYIQMFTCNFELKPGHIPTIQLKNNLSFLATEYVKSSKGEDITLCLTSVDLKLFLTHYDIYNVTWLSGWKFKSTDSLFKDYIDKWNGIKVKAAEENNPGLRTLAKLMLNSLYGKFALNPKVRSKYPYLDNGIVKYALGEQEERKPIYIPVGTFITAYARYKTITSAQMVYDRFCYADTDSLHLIGEELPPELEIHPTKLGCWKHEATFTRAKYIRQKTYIEEIDGKLEITCAGMPKQCYKNVTWENFKENSVFEGKLIPKHVQGGIVLDETTFTLKG